MASKPKNLPYSKSFKPHRSARIFLGEDPGAWNQCRRESKLNWTDLLLLPAAEDPFEYDWPVQKLDVLVLNFNSSADTSRIYRIMHACIEAGAVHVTAFLADDTLMVQP